MVIRSYFPQNFSQAIAPVIRDRIVVHREFDTNLVNKLTFNQFGFIRSDFSILNDLNDEAAYNAALQRLQEIQQVEPDNSNLTFEQIIDLVRPRWCQHPDDVIKFEQYCIDKKIEDLNVEKEKIEAEEAAKVALNSDNVVNDPQTPAA